MKSGIRHWLFCALIAFALVGLAVFLRIWPLAQLGERMTYVTHYPAVMGAALYGGAVGGGLATLFVVLAVCFMKPGGHIFMRDSVDLLGLGTFLFNGVLITVVGEMLRRAQRRKDEALAEARHLRMALDQIPAHIYMKDEAGRYVYANRQTLVLFGRTAQTLTGSTDSEFFPPETVMRLQAIDRRVLDKGDNTEEEVTVHGPDGARHVYWEVKTPIYDNADASRIVGMCGISTDITERDERKAQLEESEARFRATFDEASIGMALVGKDGRFERVNQALCKLFGHTESALREMTFQKISHPDDLDKDLTLLQEIVAGVRESYQIEKRYICKSGATIWTLLSVATVRDDEGEVRYFISQIQDISERKRMLDQLRDQANLDYLTGLNNRRYFIERGVQEIARAARYGKPLSLLMLDIDHFKLINDTRGHRAGDDVLRHLGRLLMHSLRNIDLCARLGGEEFAILLPETDALQAMEIAERLRSEVAAATVVPKEGPTIVFTVSIGVASTGDREANLDVLLSEADHGLYKAKRGGRDCVYVGGEAAA